MTVLSGSVMTAAMIDLYFAKPPVSDWLPIFDDDGNDQLVLACHIADSPRKRGIDPRYDARVINAEVATAQHGSDWVESTVALEEHAARTLYVDGVGKRLRGDSHMWRLRNADMKRSEQKKRAKGFHPSQRNVSPRDYITQEDRDRFKELAREAMANICHLSTYLPRCQIMATKLPIRMMEMVDWEMINVGEWGRGLTAKIEDEARAMGAQGAPEINHRRIEQLEQQREGSRFQYYFLQMLMDAFKAQYTEIQLEAEATHPEGSVEWIGKSWEYVPVLERQARKKQRAADMADQSAVEKAMLVGKLPSDWAKRYEARTGMKPRKVPSDSTHLHGARPQVAQPMTDEEIEFDNSDDLGNVQWDEGGEDATFEE